MERCPLYNRHHASQIPVWLRLINIDGQNARKTAQPQASVIILILTLLTPQEDLPSQYDLRDKGVVTPVRLQSPWSSCWAFAGIAAAETSIISDLGAPASLDLSEKHLAWFGMHTLQAADDPDQAGEGIAVFAESSDGGNAVYIPSNPVLVSTLFSAGIGPVFEDATDDMLGFPYRGVAGITELDAVTKDEYKPQWKEYR